MSGWIKLHRKMLDWEWYDDTNAKIVFLHCLLRANHKDKRWRGRVIQRGSFWTSLPSLSDELGLSIQQVRTSINKLKSTGELTDSPHAQGRLIIIKNYEMHQVDNRQPNSLVTDEQQAINSKQEVKEVKNEKKRDKDTPANAVDYSAFNMTDDEISELKRIRRKNRGGTITQRVANALAKQFNQAKDMGYSVDDILTEWETRSWKSFKAEWLQARTGKDPFKISAERDWHKEDLGL